MTDPIAAPLADAETVFRPSIPLGVPKGGAPSATIMRAGARLVEREVALPRAHADADDKSDGPVFTPSAIPEPERLRIIAEAIEDLRPILQSDGGDIELLAVKGHRVEVRLTGACLSCALAGTTLGHVRRRLMALLDTPVMVVPIIG